MELVFSLYYLMVPPISPAAFPDGPELVNVSLVLYVPITEEKKKKEIIFLTYPLESLHPKPFAYARNPEFQTLAHKILHDFIWPLTSTFPTNFTILLQSQELIQFIQILC